MLASAGAAAIILSCFSDASAADNPGPEGAGEAIEAISPDMWAGAAHIRRGKGESALRGNVSDTQIDIPVAAADGLGIGNYNGEQITIGLPFSATAEEAQTIDKGVVAYDNMNSSVTVPIVRKDGSVSLNTVIESAAAPERYDYAIGMPAGSTMTLREGGGVAIYGADGDFVGAFAPPWARDLSGAAIPTHYEINGSNLTQIVAHTGGSTTYPVVADPWYSLRYIDKVKRENTTRGVRYKVYPTIWGRTMNNTWEPLIAWSQAKARGVPQRQGLFEQFICHPWSQVARVKSSWNLDTWRPTVGLVKTIAKGCNP